MVCNPSLFLRCGKCKIGANFVLQQEGEIWGRSNEIKPTCNLLTLSYKTILTNFSHYISVGVFWLCRSLFSKVVKLLIWTKSTKLIKLWRKEGPNSRLVLEASFNLLIPKVSRNLVIIFIFLPNSV